MFFLQSAVFASSVIPDDFKVIAGYGPGFSDWKPWDVTITRDGKVSQKAYIFGNNGEETEISKTFSLSERDVADLVEIITGSDFFNISKNLSYPVTDNETLSLAITMGRVSHQVRVYAPVHLKERAEVKRFLQVWGEVMKKVPSPNDKATVQRPPTVIASAEDTPEEMIRKTGCSACHKVPTVFGGVGGTLGPVLSAKTTAHERIEAPEYIARIKTGKARARTPKEYVVESILDPSAFIVPGFELKSAPGASMMPSDYGDKFTYQALDKLADFLLSLDESAAR
ncbi:MAG: hypothetical protein ACOYXR_05610 [Nitrospirota bacterium]